MFIHLTGKEGLLKNSSGRIRVRTADALTLCQRLLKTGTDAQKAAAESVLSALIVTLRHETVFLPKGIEPLYELLTKGDGK